MMEVVQNNTEQIDQPLKEEPTQELLEATNVIANGSHVQQEEDQDVHIAIQVPAADPVPEYKIIIDEGAEDYNLNSPPPAAPDTCVSLDSKALLESEDFDQLLIEEIRKNRLLWDSSAIDYKEPSKRKQVWNEISKNLDITNVDLLRRKWRYLRDGYSRSLKRRREQERSGSTFKHPPKCRYFNELQFLSEVLVFDDGDYKVPIPAPSDIVDAESPLTIPAKRKKVNTPGQQKMKDFPDDTNILFSSPKNVGHVEEFVVKSSNELFCASLVESLDRMTYKNNRLARIDIMRILTNYEFEVE